MPTDTKPPPAPTPITDAPKRPKKPKPGEVHHLGTLDADQLVLSLLKPFLEVWQASEAEKRLQVSGLLAHMSSCKLAELLRLRSQECTALAVSTPALRTEYETHARVLLTMASQLLVGATYALAPGDFEFIFSFVASPEPPPRAEPERVPFAEIVERQKRGEHVTTVVEG